MGNHNVCFFYHLQTYICPNECSFTVNTLEQMFMRDLSLLEPKDVEKETDVECRVFNNTWTSDYIVK